MNLDNIVPNVRTFLGSTTTPLGGGGVFPGPTTFVDGWVVVTGTVFADQDGYISVQHSHDGVNWDGETVTEYTANDEVNFVVPLNAAYFRMRFINDAVAQGIFRMYWYGNTKSPYG